MSFNGTITISIVLAFVALLAPSLTALINNHHQKKMRELELQSQHEHDIFLYQRDIIDNYFRFTGQAISDETSRHFIEYGKYYGLALRYLPPDCVKLAKDIHHHLRSDEYGDALDKFEILISLYNKTK